MEIKLPATLNASASCIQRSYTVDEGPDLWRVILFFGDATIKVWDFVDGVWVDPTTKLRYYISQSEDLEYFIAEYLKEAWFGEG